MFVNRSYNDSNVVENIVTNISKYLYSTDHDAYLYDGIKMMQDIYQATLYRQELCKNGQRDILASHSYTLRINYNYLNKPLMNSINFLMKLMINIVIPPLL